MLIVCRIHLPTLSVQVMWGALMISVLLSCFPLDNHTACISYRGLSRLQMSAWSQIAPLLKIFLQKERGSQILLLPLSCLSGLIHILICNTKIGEKSDMTKSWVLGFAACHKQELLLLRNL